jgi:hypothetical protein
VHLPMNERLELGRKRIERQSRREVGRGRPGGSSECCAARMKERLALPGQCVVKQAGKISHPIDVG